MQLIVNKLQLIFVFAIAHINSCLSVFLSVCPSVCLSLSALVTMKETSASLMAPLPGPFSSLQTPEPSGRSGLSLFLCPSLMMLLSISPRCPAPPTRSRRRRRRRCRGGRAHLFLPSLREEEEEEEEHQGGCMRVSGNSSCHFTATIFGTKSALVLTSLQLAQIA